VFPEYAIIAVAVVGGVIILAAVVVAVVFGVPSIRKRVFPHRDRQKFSAQKHY